MTLITTIIAVTVVYSIVCLCLGGLVNRALSGGASTADISAGTALASAFLLGQGILANVWLLIAIPGWFKPSVVLSVMALVFVLGSVFVWRNAVLFLRQLRGIWFDLRKESWGWQIAAFLTILLYLAGFTSLGRQFFGDAAAFYMALPKVIAASHRLIPLPGFDAFTQIGLQGEMHYAAMMLMGSPDAAQLFAWPTILAGAVMLVAISSKAGLGRRGQWIVLTCVFSSSAVTWLSGDGKVDLFAAALGLAACFWALRIQERQDVLSIRLAGLFTGTAVVAKFSYLPTLLPAVAALVLYKTVLENRGKERAIVSWKRAGSIFLRIGLWMVPAVFPHLIKNYALFGNPLAPFSASGMGWASQKWFGSRTTRRIVLTYPLALTFGRYWAQYGNLSPLVLAFLPLALLLPRKKLFRGGPLEAITLAALVGLICWVLLHPSVLSPRYILCTLLLLIPLGARAAEYVSQTETGVRFISFGVLACILITQVTYGLHFLNVVFFPYKTKQYLAGQISQLDRDDLYCRLLTTLGQGAEPGDRVVFAAYHRYWLRPDLLQCASRDTELGNLMGQTSEAFWNGILEGNFRYLVVDKSSHGKVEENLKEGKHPDWIRISILCEEGNMSVYRLEFTKPPRESMLECIQAAPPAWDVVAR